MSIAKAGHLSLVARISKGQQRANQAKLCLFCKNYFKLLGFSFAKGSNTTNNWCLCLRESDSVTIPTAVFLFKAGMSLQGPS